jgi:hypothetical protein
MPQHGLQELCEASINRRRNWHWPCSLVKKKRRGGIMKFNVFCLSVFALIGSLGVSAARAADGVLIKDKLTPGSYCHEKFPAIRPSTLGTHHPSLKKANTGDVIDFYGACGESPTGKDQVWQQKLDEQHRFDTSYDD